ncbi:MAG: DGQHR domain-containing protein [Rhodocyclaceae bacterium]|nr:DGQHR domain-containing protein [Rhodocyclaceae bacterium]
MSNKMIERISVVVPENPFTPPDLKAIHHCLCALDVEKLMEWWPGLPHKPHPDPKKVKAIQRSLDWKRVAQIGAYLLQEEIQDCGELLDEVFGPIYHPRKNDPGREWPPQIRGTVRFARSSFPFFTNVLVHVNGATFDPNPGLLGTAEIGLNPSAKGFQLSVIDGQHRVNGAYFALMLRRKKVAHAKFEIPAEIFLDLDPIDKEPRRQAQIFIDVNLYQKKVDRSLVADLFPTTRGEGPLDRKDRAQDIGRKLMLEVGPLVGMIQIPGVKYGVKDVVTLATLNSAIEGAIPALDRFDINNLEAQTAFIAQMLDCWLQASGRAHDVDTNELDPQNVVYQGRILVSVIDLISAVLAHLKQAKTPFVSEKARIEVTRWFRGTIERANLLSDGKFVVKDEFKKLGFLGSGGIGRFRNLLWAASMRKRKLDDIEPERLIELAMKARAEADRAIG